MRISNFVTSGILIVGLIIQLIFGPMNWDLVIWPVNMFVLLAFIVFLLLLYRLRRKSTLCNSITTIKTAVPAIITALLVTIVMGLTRQTKEEAVGALTMLGFAQAPSSKVVTEILRGNPDMPVEQVIKQALKLIK